MDSASNVVADRLSRQFLSADAQRAETETIQFVNRNFPGFLMVKQTDVLKEVMNDIRTTLMKNGRSRMLTEVDLNPLNDLVTATNLRHPADLHQVYIVGEVRAVSGALAVFAHELSLLIDHVRFNEEPGSLDWVRGAGAEIRVLVVAGPVEIGKLPPSAFSITVTREEPTAGDETATQWMKMSEYGGLQFGTFFLGWNGFSQPIEGPRTWRCPPLRIGDCLGLPRDEPSLPGNASGDRWLYPDGNISPLLTTEDVTVPLGLDGGGKVVLRDDRTKLQQLLNQGETYTELRVRDALALLGCTPAKWERKGSFELDSTEGVGTLLSGVPVLAARRLSRRQLKEIQDLAAVISTQRHNAALRVQASFGLGTPEPGDIDPALVKCLAQGRGRPSSIRPVGGRETNYNIRRERREPTSHHMVLRRRVPTQLDPLDDETTDVEIEVPVSSTAEELKSEVGQAEVGQDKGEDNLLDIDGLEREELRRTADKIFLLEEENHSTSPHEARTADETLLLE